MCPLPHSINIAFMTMRWDFWPLYLPHMATAVGFPSADELPTSSVSPKSYSYAFCLDVGVFRGGEKEGENITENSPYRSDASTAQVPNFGGVSSLV